MGDDDVEAPPGVAPSNSQAPMSAQARTGAAMRTADFTCTPPTRGACGAPVVARDPTAVLCQKTEYFLGSRDASALFVRWVPTTPVRIYSKRSGSLREISSHSGWNENQPAACPAELSRV